MVFSGVSLVETGRPVGGPRRLHTARASSDVEQDRCCGPGYRDDHLGNPTLNQPCAHPHELPWLRVWTLTLNIIWIRRDKAMHHRYREVVLFKPSVTAGRAELPKRPAAIPKIECITAMLSRVRKAKLKVSPVVGFGGLRNFSQLKFA